MRLGNPEALRIAPIRANNLLSFERALLLDLYQVISYGYIVSRPILPLIVIHVITTKSVPLIRPIVGNNELEIEFYQAHQDRRCHMPELLTSLSSFLSCQFGFSTNMSGLPKLTVYLGIAVGFLALVLHFKVPIVAAGLSALGLQLIMLDQQLHLSETRAGCSLWFIATVALLRCLVGSSVLCASLSL